MAGQAGQPCRVAETWEDGRVVYECGGCSVETVRWLARRMAAYVPRKWVEATADWRGSRLELTLGTGGSFVAAKLLVERVGSGGCRAVLSKQRRSVDRFSGVVAEAAAAALAKLTGFCGDGLVGDPAGVMIRLCAAARRALRVYSRVGAKMIAGEDMLERNVAIEECRIVHRSARGEGAEREAVLGVETTIDCCNLPHITVAVRAKRGARVDVAGEAPALTRHTLKDVGYTLAVANMLDARPLWMLAWTRKPGDWVRFGDASIEIGDYYDIDEYERSIGIRISMPDTPFAAELSIGPLGRRPSIHLSMSTGLFAREGRVKREMLRAVYAVSRGARRLAARSMHDAYAAILTLL